MKSQKNEINENVAAQKENQNINENKETSDIAETVVMILIDKIISTAVITNKVNQTYKTLNDHCFNFLTNFINPYLDTSFIFYENGIEDYEFQKKQIYFSHEPLEKINTWELIPEPNACEMDRYANNKTKVIKFNKYTGIKMDNVKESSVAFDASEDTRLMRSNENVSEDIVNMQKNKKKEKEEEKTYDKYIKENKNKEFDTNKSQKFKSFDTKSSNNSLMKSSQKLHEVNKDIKPKPKIKINPKRFRLNKYLEDNAPKKKEKEEILEISVTDDLPKETYENTFTIMNSNDENNKLRREREIQIEQRNAMRLAEIEREKKAKQKLYRRSEKDFDTNRLTFDPNGKIINLRSINEPLAGDFVCSKIKVKSEQNKKKEILELKDVVYPIQGMELNNTKYAKNDIYTNIKDGMNKIDADISKITVEKNIEDKINNNFNKKNKEKEKGSILPSGYNFDKFVPEVGVVITGENEKDKKEGGFEYIKKFNKPSFNELSRFISQSLNSNNFSSYLNTSDLNSNNKSISNEYLKTDENNYIGYKEEFNENNPLMQNVHKMNNVNLKYSSPDLKNFNTLKIYNSNSRQRKLLNSYDKINTEIGVNQSIHLSKNFDTNNIHLKNIFEEPLTSNLGKNYIKSIDVNDFDKMNYFEKAVLPFKKFTNKKKLNEQKQMQLEKEKLQKKNSDEAYINKFNSKIINNKDWGKEDNDPAKIQQKLLEEMENENKPKNLRLPRINNNRMKNLGMQIMTEGNNIRQRKTPLFGGNFK